MPSPIDPDLVAAAVGRSRRYRHVAPAVIGRLAREEAGKAAGAADAEKRTKRRLHQIFGAYHTPLPWDKLLARLAAARADPAGFRAACAEVLRGHASTAERLAELDTFYPRLFKITGKPGSILDLACGLNPVAWPWMNLPADTRYTACDIDVEMARFLQGFFEVAGVGGGRAELVDLIAGPPMIEADLALLLKTLPCLRHQVEDLGAIIDGVRARCLAVSFPTRSLGGAGGKGMSQTYRQFFEELARPRGWAWTEVAFGSELVFVVKR